MNEALKVQRIWLENRLKVQLASLPFSPLISCSQGFRKQQWQVNALHQLTFSLSQTSRFLHFWGNWNCIIMVVFKFCHLLMLVTNENPFASTIFTYFIQWWSQYWLSAPMPGRQKGFCLIESGLVLSCPKSKPFFKVEAHVAFISLNFYFLFWNSKSHGVGFHLLGPV